MVSRPVGRLMDLEYRILDAVGAMRSRDDDAYGFAIARAIADDERAPGLVGHGTLYKALARLVARGLLSSAWEDSAISDEHGRPRRRLYAISADGEAALRARTTAATPAPAPASGQKPALA